MNGVISPYHLTTREPAALTALLLCQSVVTFLPTPASGEARDPVRAAFRTSPRYERALRSWLWSAPLWRAGVVTSIANDGDPDSADPFTQIQSAAALAEGDAGLAPLAGLMHEGFFRSPEACAESPPSGGLSSRVLDLLGADLLKGGPDPGIALPICAGLDRFAARNGLVGVRSGGRAVLRRRIEIDAKPGTVHSNASGTMLASSVAQRAEARLAATARSVSFAIPVVVEGGGRTILDLRAELAAERADLTAVALATLDDGGSTAPVRARAAAFAAAFAQSMNAREGRDDDSGTRVVSGMVRITLARVPVDASLVAAVVAARSIGVRGRAAERTAPPQTFVAMTVEPMVGVRAAVVP